MPFTLVDMRRVNLWPYRGKIRELEQSDVSIATFKRLAELEQRKRELKPRTSGKQACRIISGSTERRETIVNWESQHVSRFI